MIDNTGIAILHSFSKLYPPNSWVKFYRPKLDNFFESIGATSLKDIEDVHVRAFLSELPGSPYKKLNYYNALSSFYNFAALEFRIPNVMSGIEKPSVERSPFKYIADEHIAILKESLNGENLKFSDKLLLGFIMFTGLSRIYIFELYNRQIIFSLNDSRYFLQFEAEDGCSQIPLSLHLVPLIQAYAPKSRDPFEKVFDYNETYISDRISTLTKKVTGTAYSPQSFSDTFIKQALSVEPDIYAISRLTRKSIATIEKHLPISGHSINEKQLQILDKI